METTTHPLDVVPAAHRAPIAAALAAAFGSRPVQSLAPLGGGLSSALVYRAVVDGQACLVRAVTHVDAFSDPARHIACLRVAADAGLAPRVLHADTAATIVVTAFIEAQPFAASQRPRPALLADLADAVRRLQATPPFPPLVDYIDGIDDFVAELRTWHGLPPAALPVFDRYGAIGRAYPRIPEDQVSSHNDLNPGNLIWNGAKLWIVDWEAAFRNDRYVDPAHICNYYAQTPREEAAFLAAWLGAPPSAVQQARLKLMRLVARMFYATMFLRLARAEQPGLSLTDADLLAPPPVLSAQLLSTTRGKVRFALGALQQIDAATRDPAFEAALKIVRG